MLVKYEYDCPSLVVSMANAIEREKRIILATGIPLSPLEEHDLEFAVLNSVFNEEHLLHYTGWFYPFRKEFLKTYYWSIVRGKVLADCNYQCQGIGCSQSARVVHHLDYSICGEEHRHINKLAGLCVEHHNAQHSSVFDGPPSSFVSGPNRYDSPFLKYPKLRTMSPGSPLCYLCQVMNKKSYAQWLYSKPNGEAEVYVNTTTNFLVCSPCHDELITRPSFIQSRFFNLTDMDMRTWLDVLYSYIEADCKGNFEGLGRKMDTFVPMSPE